MNERVALDMTNFASAPDAQRVKSVSIPFQAFSIAGGGVVPANLNSPRATETSYCIYPYLQHLQTMVLTPSQPRLKVILL